MREEEKLARDVYAYLYDRYQLPVFTNITSSEQKHTDSVGMLLQKYTIPDTTATLAAGEFADETMKNLYTSLTQKGATSLKDALKVGIQIEELDIADIDTLLAGIDTESDIATVYTNLKN